MDREKSGTDLSAYRCCHQIQQCGKIIARAEPGSLQSTWPSRSKKILRRSCFVTGPVVGALLVARRRPASPGRGLALLGIISLVLGFGSVVVGWLGVLHGKSKRDWLCRRVITERLRQSHFQAFCCRWPAISSSLHGKAAEEEYRALRRTWLDPIRDQLTLHAGAELTEFLDQESETKCWLTPRCGDFAGAQDRAAWQAPSSLKPSFECTLCCHQREPARESTELSEVPLGSVDAVNDNAG